MGQDSLVNEWWAIAFSFSLPPPVPILTGKESVADGRASLVLRARHQMVMLACTVLPTH